MQLDPNWEFVADTVMGGVSRGTIVTERIDGREATRLSGTVSLDNNGGFVQMAFDLAPDGSLLDASDFSGIEIEIRGNSETYDLRLRTDQLARPWHSFRTEIEVLPKWQSLRIPFSAFEPHRTSLTLDLRRLRRFGVLAIGREFEADVAVAAIRLYKAP